jgi:PEP-CTERM motif
MRIINIVLIAIAISFAPTALASIIYDQPLVINGAGFGNYPRLLTVQAHGNASTESGCIGLDGTNLVSGPSACSGLGPLGGDEGQPLGFPKQSAPTLGSLGITSASDLFIIFDATEPAGDAITVNQLVLKFYSSSGVLLQSQMLAVAQTFMTTTPGNGKTDYQFKLDPLGVANVNSTIFASPGFQNIRIALESRLTDVHGGPESFLVLSAPQSGVGVAAVPEPTSIGLVTIGGALLALWRRRHASSSALTISRILRP